MGRVVAVALGYDFLPGTTITRYCSSSLQTTRMAVPRDQGGRGRRLHQRRRRDGQPLHQGQQRLAARHDEPALRRRAGPHAPKRGAEGAELDRPARGRRRPRRLHRDGRRPPRTSPGSRASPARRWTSSPPARRTSPRRPSPTASWSARSPRSPRRTAPSMTKDDGPRAGVTVEGMAGLKPVFRPDGLVTAGNACPLNDGAAAVIVMSDTKAARARPHAARPHRLHRRHRPVAGDHGLRPGRGHQPRAQARPARPSTTSTCSRSTRRSPRRSSRPTRTWASRSTSSTSRRRDRRRPPVRHDRRPHHRHADQRPADARQAVRRRDHVRRRRHGHGDGARAPELVPPPLRRPVLRGAGRRRLQARRAGPLEQRRLVPARRGPREPARHRLAEQVGAVQQQVRDAAVDVGAGPRGPGRRR